MRFALILALLCAPLTLSAQETQVAPGSGAVLRGLDRVSGVVEDITLQSGASAVFGRLTITLTECRYPVDDPASDAFAYLTIHDAMTPQGAVFQGWLIASSPAINAMDHARFDIWLLRCTTS